MQVKRTVKAQVSILAFLDTYGGPGTCVLA